MAVVVSSVIRRHDGTTADAVRGRRTHDDNPPVKPTPFMRGLDILQGRLAGCEWCQLV
jgi:hypothetical protein